MVFLSCIIQTAWRWWYTFIISATDYFNTCHVLFYQVLCVGQIIGGVLAETRELANKASSIVKVEYEEMPAIFTIEVSAAWYFLSVNNNAQADVLELWKHLICFPHLKVCVVLETYLELILRLDLCQYKYNPLVYTTI